MFRPRLRFCAVVALILFFAGSCASQDKNDHARGADDGFVSIFNGQDLTGWFYVSKAGEGYRIRDGALYCTAGDGGNLFTEKEYDNFILRLEFKLTPGANNGIAIRTPRQGKVTSEGNEIQILDDTAEKYARLRPTQYCGSLYDVFPAERGHLKPVGEWNTEEITAHGRRITVKLNGVKVVDANLDDVKDPAVLDKHPGLKRTTGHIGFLGHGSEAEFRNVRIKEL